MRLYIVMLGTIDGTSPQRTCFTEQESGFFVRHETENCWYLDHPPRGLPKRYRKAGEYKLTSNKSGIYMFGTDSGKLVREWNCATFAAL